MLLRTATDRGAYHFVEVYHERGRLIPFDLGYIDFDNPKRYREIFIGGGLVLVDARKATLITEGFLVKAFGEHANGALYVMPFFLGIYRIAPGLAAEASYLPYLPLNDASDVQHVLERAKIDYDFGRVKVGGGYGAYKFSDADWHHKPFITTTLKAGGLGNLELWLQRIPGGVAAAGGERDYDLSVQIRYAKTFRH